jgi:predicted ATP-grasp superfamily ATP-dependent carboligase
MARNLAEHGVRVCVLGSATSVARFSRSVCHFIKWPRGLKEDELPYYLVKIAERFNLRQWVLFPSSDEHMRIIAQHSSLLAEHYVLTTPPWETVKFLYDKRLTYKLAQEAGVAIPDSHVPGNAERLASLDVDFPVVLKPAVTSHFMKVTNKKAYLAENRQELQRLYNTMSKVIGPSKVIVQDFLPEPTKNLFSFAGYFRKGVPIIGLSVKRMRQLPPDFGRSSTFVEAVEVTKLKELASKLLRIIHYTGLAELEFMWDVKHARFELLEVNARLWAWHGLAIAGGLELPYVAFADAVGQTPTLGTMREGIKWVRFLTDVRAAAHDMRSGKLSIRHYLISLHGPKAFSIFSPSDPLPSIVEPFLKLLNHLNRLASIRRALSFQRHKFQKENKLHGVVSRGDDVKANK